MQILLSFLLLIFLNSCSKSPLPLESTATNATITAQFSQAGEVFRDEDFGTNIMRLTDGENCGVAYSYWPTFNKNSTRLIITCNNKPLIYKLDPQNFKLISKEPLFTNKALNAEDAIWSSIDPDLIYAHDLKQLWAYNTATKNYELAGDLQALLPSGHHIFQMSKSIDDNIFAWTEKDADYKNTGYVVYNKNQNKIIYRQSTPQLDEVQLDKSGRYLTVKTGNETTGQIRVKIIDLATQKVTNLTGGAPDFACGHSDNGAGFTVGSDNYNNTLQYRSLSAPQNTKNILSFGNDWTQALHLSLLADNEDWALVSTYSTTPSSGPYHDEIFLLATDGSQRVRHLARHHSVYTNYEDSPKANISRDGKFAAYTSNMGGGLHSVFIVKITPENNPETPHAPAQVSKYTMSPGEYLTAGDAKFSENGKYYLFYQTDGNLVLYDGYGTALKSTNTFGDPGKAIMQTDGNFVVYDFYGNAVWNSNTYGNEGAGLNLGNDGSLKIIKDGITIRKF